MERHKMYETNTYQSQMYETNTYQTQMYETNTYQTQNVRNKHVSNTKCKKQTRIKHKM